jgi:hypothetical protein
MHFVLKKILNKYGHPLSVLCCLVWLILDVNTTTIYNIAYAFHLFSTL